MFDILYIILINIKNNGNKCCIIHLKAITLLRLCKQIYIFALFLLEFY